MSKHVPFNDLFLFSLVSNTSIVGMNLSLMLNSVGFYQVSVFLTLVVRRLKDDLGCLVSGIRFMSLNLD